MHEIQLQPCSPYLKLLEEEGRSCHYIAILLENRSPVSKRILNQMIQERLLDSETADCHQHFKKLKIKSDSGESVQKWVERLALEQQKHNNFESLCRCHDLIGEAYRCHSLIANMFFCFAAKNYRNIGAEEKNQRRQQLLMRFGTQLPLWHPEENANQLAIRLDLLPLMRKSAREKHADVLLNLPFKATFHYDGDLISQFILEINHAKLLEHALDIGKTATNVLFTFFRSLPTTGAHLELSVDEESHLLNKICISRCWQMCDLLLDLSSILLVKAYSCSLRSTVVGDLCTQLFRRARPYLDKIIDHPSFPMLWDEYIYLKRVEIDLEVALYVQKRILSPGGPNCFYPPSEQAKLEAIGSEIQTTLDRVVKAKQFITPDFELLPSYLMEIGGCCFGISAQCAKIASQCWQEDDFEKKLQEWAKTYSQQATRDAFITQVAYVALHDQEAKWQSLVQAFHQLLSHKRPHFQATALFLLCAIYGIEKSKLYYYLKKNCASGDRVQIFSLLGFLFFSGVEKRAALTLKPLWEEPSPSQQPSNALLLELGICDKGERDHLLELISGFYYARRLKGRLTSKWHELPKAKEVAELARMIFLKSCTFKHQNLEFRPLFWSLGLDYQPVPHDNRGDERAIISSFLTQADDGIYELAFSTNEQMHACTLILRCGSFYFFDPNFPLSDDMLAQCPASDAGELILSFISIYPLPTGKENHKLRFAKLQARLNVDCTPFNRTLS